MFGKSLRFARGLEGPPKLGAQSNANSGPFRVKPRIDYRVAAVAIAHNHVATQHTLELRARLCGLRL
jgi:hypothetical protein